MSFDLTEKDRKWMKLALCGAKLFSTCGRRQYMAIIVDSDSHVIATGYNGGPKGFTHCVDGGCPRMDTDVPHGSNYNNCIAIHAEANALLHSDYTARRGGATIYINGPPCWDCAKLIANSGITKIVYFIDSDYVDWKRVRSFLLQANITLVPVTELECHEGTSEHPDIHRLQKRG